MTNPDTEAEDSERSLPEFYLPATFQYSTEPGRIERILVGLFENRGGLEARIVTEEPTKEFYVPAMYRFSTDPGRIERFLDAVFAERGTQEFRQVPEQFADVFYLPATDPETFRRRDDRPHVPLVPAPELSAEEKRPPESST